jgi:tRNA-binding protein
MTATWDEFEWLELAVGVLTPVRELPEARNTASRLTIDFGPRGTKHSSARAIHYAKAEVLGRQVVCVLGFEPKRVRESAALRLAHRT